MSVANIALRRHEVHSACRVCGCRDLQLDEVALEPGSAGTAGRERTAGGVVELAECRRCAHRWTRARYSEEVRVEPGHPRVVELARAAA